MISGVLIIFVSLLAVELIRRRRKKLRFFKDRGIPGPEPHFLWGHFFEISSDHLYWINEWSNEFGDPFGVFLGDKPFLVTQNLDIAREVLIKQFPKFTNRGRKFGLEENHPLKLFALHDDPVWKHLRSAVSPGFSSKKIREMTPLILKSIEGFRRKLITLSASQEAFDVYPLLQKLTMENIGRTIFGVDLNTQADTNVSSPLEKTAIYAPLNMMRGRLDLICTTFEWKPN
ncbi:probable cytochrome P450 6a18 [Galendromus occidentalis]|uniref:Probable cytochrome P450 6a18 n=1 Tax=Galendromus occidentalis TaxID=34638 RepID=A0AAJ7L4Y0_9ACAR|nr:probable cytochrome P450 6a18 [Galendromus occidentalis]